MSDSLSQIKVLHITMKWDNGRGGVKQFILNAKKALDANRFCQEVLSVGPIAGEDMGLQLNGPVTKKQNPVALVAAASNLRNTLERLSPDAVHIHCNNGLGFLYAEAARRAGCRVRVVHSHSTAYGSAQTAKRVASAAFARVLSSAPTKRAACSSAAGAHLFGKEPFEVVRNSIDVDRFSFSLRERSDVRLSLGVGQDSVVLGNVGAGLPVKNSGFVIRAVYKLAAEGLDAHALLIGKGEETPALVGLANALGVADRIHFQGVVSDAWRYYNAMDVFLLPSFYEGQPISLIEAQANGLPCVVSDAVSGESDVTGLVTFLSLEDGAEGWAGCIAGEASRGASIAKRSSGACREMVSRAGFSLDALGKQLEGLYLSAGVISD